MANCDACQKHANISDRMQCCCCKKIYHYQCLNITDEQYTKNTHMYDISWTCSECANVTRRQRNDNTPARSIHSSTLYADSECEQSFTGDTQTSNILAKTTSQDVNVSDLSKATHLKELSDLLDSKLKLAQHQIITEISSRLEVKITITMQELKQELFKDVKILKLEQTKMSNHLTKIDNDIKKLEEEKLNLEKQIEKLSSKISQNQAPCTNSPTNDCCDNSRKVVLYGLDELYGENEYVLNNRIIEIFEELYNVDLGGYIDQIFRLGRKGYRRPIVIELTSKIMCKYITQNYKFLKNTGLYISEYYDEEKRKERIKMQELMNSARREGKHAIIRNNRLIIDGKEHYTGSKTVKYDNENSYQQLNESKTENHTFRK